MNRKSSLWFLALLIVPIVLAVYIGCAIHRKETTRITIERIRERHATNAPVGTTH